LEALGLAVMSAPEQKGLVRAFIWTPTTLMFWFLDRRLRRLGDSPRISLGDGVGVGFVRPVPPRA